MTEMTHLDEMCPRCGADMQATHHPLCEERDGTPTGLSDKAIRQALAVIRRRQMYVIANGATHDL